MKQYMLKPKAQFINQLLSLSKTVISATHLRYVSNAVDRLYDLEKQSAYAHTRYEYNEFLSAVHDAVCHVAEVIFAVDLSYLSVEVSTEGSFNSTLNTKKHVTLHSTFFYLNYSQPTDASAKVFDVVSTAIGRIVCVLNTKPNAELVDKKIIGPSLCIFTTCESQNHIIGTALWHTQK